MPSRFMEGFDPRNNRCHTSALPSQVWAPIPTPLHAPIQEVDTPPPKYSAIRFQKASRRPWLAQDAEWYAVPSAPDCALMQTMTQCAGRSRSSWTATAAQIVLPIYPRCPTGPLDGEENDGYIPGDPVRCETRNHLQLRSRNQRKCNWWMLVATSEWPPWWIPRIR